MRPLPAIAATTALIAGAIGAVWTSAASASVFADDTAVQFAAGTPGPATDVVEVGTVRLKPAIDWFAGTSLPVGLSGAQWAPPNGTWSVGAGVLTADGARVQGATTYAPGEELETSASFSGAAAQHVGFAVTLDDGPWAIISTGGGGGLGASTRATPGATPTFDPISVPNPTGSNTYRIEWSATAVRYYLNVGGVAQLVASRPVAITSQMRPMVSDYTADSRSVRVNSLAVTPLVFATSGTYESNVKDATDPRAVWRTLDPIIDTPAGTAVVLQTRSGNTATPDASWSGYQPPGAGGAIQSPSRRYIQYRATLSSSDAHVTPTVDRVDLTYDIDTIGPRVTVGRAKVKGRTARVTFSSPDRDMVRFQCTVDRRAFATCKTPKTFIRLAPGSHKVSVRGVDALGNIGPVVSSRFSIGGRPKVSVAAKSLRVSKRGTVSFRVGCPKTAVRCKVTLRLKRAGKTVASKTVSVKGGKTTTVTLVLNKATRRLLGKRGSLKLSSVVSATDTAGHHSTTTKKLTLRRATG
jgi:hypothetical protein